MIIRKLLAVFICLYVALTSFAQLKYNRIDSIPININGDTLGFGWAGGLNNPQFSEIDFNFDGLPDLFIYEKDGGLIRTFINKGIAGESSYEYTNAYQDKFPAFKNFVLLRDYDCDGKMDIFTGATGGLRVYRNRSSPIFGLYFELVSTLLYSDYNSNRLNLYVPSTDVPVIDDLDNDGDLDILTFGVVGSTVEHHENISMDLYGICDSLTFKLASSCWGNFAENAVDNGVTLGMSCKGNVANHDTTTERGLRHSGSTLLTIDIDDDGDKEFIAGDVSFNNLVMLTNGGDQFTANMISQTHDFPLSSQPVDLPIFPAAFYLDVNNDSIKDLIVAPTAKNVSENTNSVWLYTNSGKNTLPSFAFQADNFLQSEMIDVGSGANPVFFDANADGLMDIVVGNYGYYDENTATFAGKLLLLENIGTVNTPSFQVSNTDYQGISALKQNGLYPAFGDMDNDGDDDLIIGDANGVLHFYENTAGTGNVPSFSFKSSNYMNIDVGYFATPFIIDYNHDGLNDLLIGERAGTIKYYENRGTQSTAFFGNTATIDMLAEIDVMKPCCTGYSNVHANFDVNNNLNLFVGSEKGIVYEYRSSDNSLTSFNLIDSIITEGNRVNASLADIDDNNSPEIVSGHYTGGISLYSKTSSLRLVYPLDKASNLNDSLTIDWSSVEHIDFYEVWVDTTFNFNSSLKIDSILPFINNDGNGLDTELQLNGLLHGITYYWKVRIISGIDSSNWTATWQFTVSETGDPISVIENQDDSSVNVYPNPATHFLTIEMKGENSENEFVVYDINGKMVLNQVLIGNKNNIDTQLLSKGMYFGIITISEKKQHNFKFIKE